MGSSAAAPLLAEHACCVAGGVLIKSLHTKKGAQVALKQLKVLGVSLICAFLWDVRPSSQMFCCGACCLHAEP